MNALLFDIGGTRSRFAVTTDGRRFSVPVVVATPRRFDRALALYETVLRRLSPDRRFTAASGCVAGVLGTDADRLVSAPNVPAWKGKRLATALRRLTGTAVHLMNDADAAGLAEARRGAGKGQDIVAFLTLSTGVGGARIVHGRLDVSRFGFEPGHSVLDLRGPRCRTCGNSGEVESLISGSALERRWGVPPKQVLDRRRWNEVSETLAAALVNVTVFWSPDVIVLGGALVRPSALRPAEVQRRLRTKLKLFGGRGSRVVPGRLGDAAGLWGALMQLAP